MSDAQTAADTGDNGDVTPEAGAEREPLMTPPENEPTVSNEADTVAREEPQEGEELRPEPPLEGEGEGDSEPNADDPFRPKAEERPEWAPEQFWNKEEGRLEVQKLAKSYADLRAHMNQQAVGAPDEYKVELPEGWEGLTDDDVEVFKEANLTNAQAQKMVDYVNETMLPVVQEAIAGGHKQALAAKWNMEPDNTMFQERMTRLRDWAYSNYPEQLVNHMARSAEGVDQLFQMMRSSANDSVRGEQTAQQKLSKAEIDSMVSDPRYWTDEAYRAEVERKVGLSR